MRSIPLAKHQIPLAKHQPTLAIIGGGPTALMTTLEAVRNAADQHGQRSPLKITIISSLPKEKLGYGDVMDTVHEEVLFNVPTAKMSLSEAQEQADELVDLLKDSDKTRPDPFIHFNTAKELGAQFVPRVLMQDLVKEYRQILEKEAKAKNITLEFIHGTATEIEDDVQNKVHITVQKLDQEEGKNTTHELTADVAALTFGHPKRKLPDEPLLKESAMVSLDMHHPAPGHVLHPDTDYSTLPESYNTAIIGSKLSAVDALVVLSERGYFDREGHTATIVAPSGEFPYPHERELSNADGSYSRHSLLADKTLPAHLLTPKTAQDLADAIVLTCLYAAGAEYKNDELLIPHNTAENEKVLPRLQELAAPLFVGEGKETELLKEKFANSRERTYNWQVAIDQDFRPKIKDYWQSFDADNKQAWMREHEGLWNDLRHRVPPKVLDRIEELKDEGKITILPKAVTGIKPQDNIVALYADKQRKKPLVTADAMIKATGWEQRYPIDHIPLLDAMRSNRIVGVDPEINKGVVVKTKNAHNVRLIGQLTRSENYEISGLQQLRPHAAEEAGKLINMMKEQAKNRIKQQAEEPWQKRTGYGR